ncbi:hypothetical protein [Streptomyces luteireticuli]|uniref:hypothetical protein n=1 Tax=Streptomyces luteireticuli TaxID=173858 RepID=UPI003558F485
MTAVQLLVLGAVLVSAAARRASAPAPIVPAVAGPAASYVPGVPDYRPDARLALFLFVPPLVHADSPESSCPNLRADARPIALLSVGLLPAFLAGLLRRRPVDEGPDTPVHVGERLRAAAGHRLHSAWERLAAPGARAVRETTATERAVFLWLRGEGRIDDEVLRRVVHRLDLEEAMLCRD